MTRVPVDKTKPAKGERVSAQAQPGTRVRQKGETGGYRVITNKHNTPGPAATEGAAKKTEAECRLMPARRRPARRMPAPAPLHLMAESQRPHRASGNITGPPWHSVKNTGLSGSHVVSPSGRASRAARYAWKGERRGGFRAGSRPDGL